MFARPTARAVASCAAACLVIALGACSTKPPEQAGGTPLTVNAMSGTVSTLLATNLDGSYAAALRAIKELQFVVVKEAKDTLRGVIEARTADDRNVSIELERRSDTITSLDVNAGGMRTELAETVARKIQSIVK
jgi:hypothetical protein